MTYKLPKTESPDVTKGQNGSKYPELPNGDKCQILQKDHEIKQPSLST